MISHAEQCGGRFRRVVESGPCAMVLVDQEGKILLVNQQTEALFGYSRAELAGQLIDVLVADTARMTHRDFRMSFGKEPEAGRMGSGREVVCRRKDGSQFPAEIGLTPFQANNGTWVLSSIVNISGASGRKLN
jgi:PAS domain S-box-containing protein